MSVREIVAAILLWLGCGVTVLSSLALLRLRAARDRLHLLAPVSSLGVPLVGAALVVTNGWNLTSGEIVLIVALLAVSGPAVGSAVARVAGERACGSAEDAPE